MNTTILFKNTVLATSKKNFKVEENRILQVIFFEVQKNKRNIVYIPPNTFKQALKSNTLKSKNGIEHSYCWG